MKDKDITEEKKALLKKNIVYRIANWFLCREGSILGDAMDTVIGEAHVCYCCAAWRGFFLGMLFGVTMWLGWECYKTVEVFLFWCIIAVLFAMAYQYKELNKKATEAAKEKEGDDTAKT